MPIGAGSAAERNAAVTLAALNELWGLELTTTTVRTASGSAPTCRYSFAPQRLAKALANYWSRELPEQWYAVVTPPCLVSTATIFNDENLTRNSAKIRIADFLAGRCRNDCEPVTRRLYPAVEEAFAWLGKFGTVRMSGTGASVFIALPEEAAGKTVFADLPKDLERIRREKASDACTRKREYKGGQACFARRKLVKFDCWGVAKW